MIKLNLEADQVMRLSCQGMGRGDWMGGVFPGSGVSKKVEWWCAAHFQNLHHIGAFHSL